MQLGRYPRYIKRNPNTNKTVLEQATSREI